jgi:hypothetical protein
VRIIRTVDFSFLSHGHQINTLAAGAGAVVTYRWRSRRLLVAAEPVEEPPQKLKGKAAKRRAAASSLSEESSLFLSHVLFARAFRREAFQHHQHQRSTSPRVVGFKYFDPLTKKGFNTIEEFKALRLTARADADDDAGIAGETGEDNQDDGYDDYFLPSPIIYEVEV